ncbi:hypothetical protein [Phormidesmis priestleyi]|uniref:hypothetical protein n=1 Tax=Phormidesmis priestleyi TaxID=268141 RepID=UPI000AC1977C|nr:hypothetical protein [Phormidesmis priestleyi]
MAATSKINRSPILTDSRSVLSGFRFMMAESFLNAIAVLTDALGFVILNFSRCPDFEKI